MAKTKAKKPVAAIEVANALTKAEVNRLAQCEVTIDRGQRSFVDVGLALSEIRDAKLYRTEHKTFEAYCQERWAFTSRYGLMLTEAAVLVQEIGTIVPIVPRTESQVRELLLIKDTLEQVAAWKRVVERADGNPKLITAKIVREEVERVIAPKPSTPPKPEQDEQAKEEPKATAPATGATIIFPTEPAGTEEQSETKEEPAATAPVKPPKPVPLVDAWGIPVQEHAAEAFAHAHKFDELLAKLRDCANDLSALVDTPAGAHLPVNYVRTNSKAGGKFILAALENAILLVSQAKPAITDCPYAFNSHQSHGESCSVCRNRRWLGSPKGFQFPPTLTAAMKAHYGVDA